MSSEAKRYIGFYFSDGTFRAEEIPPGMTHQTATSQAQVIAQLYRGEIIRMEIFEAIDGEVTQAP